MAIPGVNSLFFCFPCGYPRCVKQPLFLPPQVDLEGRERASFALPSSSRGSRREEKGPVMPPLWSRRGERAGYASQVVQEEVYSLPCMLQVVYAECICFPVCPVCRCPLGVHASRVHAVSDYGQRVYRCVCVISSLLTVLLRRDGTPLCRQLSHTQGGYSC